VKLTSIIAIYVLFFIASAFILLPFGVRTDEEVGAERVAGQADSAPHRFDVKRFARGASVCALLRQLGVRLGWYRGPRLLSLKQPSP
jgi:predicted secreted protein